MYCGNTRSKRFISKEPESFMDSGPLLAAALFVFLTELSFVHFANTCFIDGVNKFHFE